MPIFDVRTLEEQVERSVTPAICGLTRFVESQLYGISPLDPLTIALAIAMLTLVAVAAGWLPARRATHVDPLLHFDMNEVGQ